jgi:P4 family phage/plasmid primase-like protien
MECQYKCGDFCRYLATFRVERGSEFSHTSIVKPSGAYYIPAEEEDNFFRLYKQAILFKDDLHMTEKHRDISPILIDLDFRFELNDDNIKRKFTDEHITHIIKSYVNTLRDLVEFDSIDIYVMLKPYPVIDKGMVKDGLHIVIPNLVTKPVVQYMARKTVLPLIKDILQDLDIKNNIEDIVDEAVIERNNWQMYGSSKPNCEKYTVTSILRYSAVADSYEHLPIASDDSVYAELLSIRNKFKETHVKFEKAQEVAEYEAKLKKFRKMKLEGPAFQTNQNLKKNTVENLDQIKKVIDLLDAKRAESYSEWIRVGWCLRNIDHRLLDNWIEFSQKSPKFTEGECERMWSYMRDEGLGVGTLYMWAKADNPAGFLELQKTDLSNLIFRSTSAAHHDIAKVVHFLYKYDFVCCSIKNNFWYEFRNHRWVSNDCGFGLRSKISTDVVREYSLAAAAYNTRAAAEEVEAEQQRLLDIAKKLNGIALKLKQTPFKDNIIKECREMFYVEKFEEKLDSRPHLIGFLNGVYDLQSNEFREGRPDDYISLTTGINYVSLNPDHPCVRDIHRFLSQIFTKPHIKEYVLLLLASFINGSIKEERFHIWTGSGSNGKSKLIDLFECCIGDYGCKFPVTLLTQKRAASNAANSELARAKGRRFACLQEPAEDEKLNIGLMKELTGGDKIMARAIYREPIEFKPQFKMILTCNHLPNVPSDDGGTWRRLRVVEFTSKFTENPNPDNPNEFPVDLEISGKFEDWKEHFMALLVQYHTKYQKEGIKEPEEVLKCTKEYQKNNDIILEFVEAELEQHPTSFLVVNEVMAQFKIWAKDCAPNFKLNKKKDLITGVSKTTGKHVIVNRTEGWKGWRFKMVQESFQDDLDK